MFEFPSLNGGERSTLAAIDCLASLRADLEFIAFGPKNGLLAAAIADRGIPLFPLSFHDDTGVRRPREAALAEIRQAIESAEPAILHANSLSMGRLTGALGDSLSIPRVAHLRDIIRLSNAAIADLNRNDRLIAVSQATKTYHVANGLAAERTVVVYNGVDCDVFCPRPARSELRRELGLPADANLALCIGQIGLRKGLDVTADAAVQLREEFPSLHYLVVGERNSTKEESVEFERAFIRRFDEAGMRDRLHLSGSRDDVPFLMNESDLLVHAAHQEPLGRVLLEAAASGLPIVATEVGGTGEILQNGVSAELIPPGDPHALAQAVRRLSHSADLCDRYATAARATIEDRFPIELAARNLAAVYDDLNSRIVG